MSDSKSVRLSGLKKMVGGAIGTALIALLLAWLLSSQDRAFISLGALLPAAVVLVGLIEVITGIEFTRISSAWDDLRGWQRGVLGLIVVAAAFGVMALVVVLIAPHYS